KAARAIRLRASQLNADLGRGRRGKDPSKAIGAFDEMRSSSMRGTDKPKCLDEHGAAAERRTPRGSPSGADTPLDGPVLARPDPDASQRASADPPSRAR